MMFLPLILPLITQLVPSLSKWLFGDTAAKTASDVIAAVGTVTGQDVTTEAGVTAAIATIQGKPELISNLQVQLAQIAADREKEQDAANLAAMQAAYADTANARGTMVSLSTTHSPMAWAPVAMSGIVLVSFGAAVMTALMVTLPTGSETILSILLGTLGGMATQVVSYWVGSSAGSASKNQSIVDMANNHQNTTASIVSDVTALARVKAAT